jgi:hypothetical protein
MMRIMAGVSLALALPLVACGSHHQHDGTTATLSIGPPTSELLIMNAVPATESFTATLTYADGTTADVTSQVTFVIDPLFGSFTNATLSMTGAGKTQVTGALGAKAATAEVIGRLKSIRVDSGVPPNAPDWFGGALPEDASRAPTVVYPATGVVMPRNLGDFEIHWTDASTNGVFEVSLATDFADVRAYVPGGNGAGGGPHPSFAEFLPAEWSAAVGAETAVTYRVRGVSSANPIAVGSTQPQLVALSNEAMLGGLYYWASRAADGVYGIYRHDMAKPGQPAKQFMTTAQTGNRCVACHVLSRDGKNMAITYDGGDGAATMVDVASATPQALAMPQAWNFGTFTPDGTQFLSVHGGALVVRDYATQAVLATMTASGYVTHPDLSPDGTQLAYVHPNPGALGADWHFGGGQIFVRTYDAASHTFGPERALVADANNNYYPSWSPDGKYVVYNRSSDNSTNGAYNNPSASLWVVKGDGSAAPVELAKLNSSVASLTNSWGRWAPFAQSLGAGNEVMYWVTVSSKRDFGVRLVGANQPQIWMAPFFPDRASAANDPSDVAFRLPFQNINSNNHIAQWTEQVVGLQ